MPFSHMPCISSHLTLVYSQHSLFYQLLGHADFLAKGKGAFPQKQVNDRFMCLIFYGYILVKSETKPPLLDSPEMTQWPWQEQGWINHLVWTASHVLWTVAH